MSRLTNRKKRWVSRAKTDSAHPLNGLFINSASAIPRSRASKRVSPKGPGPGMRMLIIPGGKTGPVRGERYCNGAKSLLKNRIKRSQEDEEPNLNQQNYIDS